MAKDLNRSIKIYIDNADASKKADELRNKVSRLNSELEQLAVTNGKDSDVYKKKERAYQNAEKSLGKYETKVKETERVLKNLSKATYDELIKSKQELSKALRKTERDTDDYRNKLLLLQQTEKELAKVQKEMRSEGGRQEGMWCRIADGFNKYIGLIGGAVATITGLSMTFRRLAEDVAKMDDIYSDVMKTTTMTREQVVKMNEEFKNMDTRTSREELNKLAYEAGKLGLSAEKDVLGFVKSANVLKIAMGDVLGENAALQVGKMVGVYERSTKHLQALDLEGKMLSLGAAVNELGKTSTANEQYLVNFAGRLGGIAVQANLSIDQILGFGSALDQDMQKVEMSATAFQKLIMNMFKAPEKFAEAAKIPLEEFTELMRTDMNSAIKEVLKSFAGQGGLQRLMPMFKDMGLDGARAAGAISAMANSIHKVEEAQRISNQALIEGTSALDEYNIKNNNLQARLEKARKGFKDAALELGERLNPMLLKSTKATTHLIKTLVELPKWLNENKGLVIMLASAWGIYALAVNKARLMAIAEMAIEKTSMALKATGRIVTLASAVAYNTLTGAKVRAAAATKLLQAAMASIPWGAILAVITAIGIAIYKFTTQTNYAKEAMKMFNKESLNQQTELNNIFNAYKKANEGTSEKARLLELIKSKYGAYIKDLIDEKGRITDIEIAQKKANEALRSNIALKIRDSKIAEITSKEMEKQSNVIGKINEYITKELNSQSLANEITYQIAQTFQNAGNDLKSAYQESFKILTDNRISPISNVHAFRNKTLADYLRDLSSSQANIINKSNEISNRFAGLISDSLIIEESISPIIPEREDSTVNGDSGDEDEKERLKKAEAALDLELATRQKMLKKARLKNEPEIIIAGNEYCLQSDEDYNKSMLELTVDNLQKRKELYAQGSKERIDIESQLLDIELKKQQEQGKAVADTVKDAYSSYQQTTNAFYSIRLQELQDMLDNEELTQRKFTARQLALNEETARKRLQDAENYKIIISAYAWQNAKDRENAEKSANEAVQKAQQELLNATKASVRAKIKEEEEYLREREALLKKYGLLTIKEQYAAELEAFESSNARKLLSEKEYQRARNQIALKYAMQYAQEAEQFARAGADAVKGIEQAQTAKIGAEYAKRQGELTEQYNQGIISQEDYNKEKAKLDYEQKNKELEVQKKFADVNLALQIAQITASTAQAIMSVWAVHAANPIKAGVLTALASITGLAQLAIAKAEHSRIKSMTLEAPSGGSSAPSTGVRTVNQAADGRYDVIGAEDGKTYRNVPYASNTPTGIVSGPTLISEQGPELIVSAPDLERLQKHINYPLVIEAIKDARNNTVPQRASGNYSQIPEENAEPNSSAGSGASSGYDAVIQELLLLLRYLKDHGIFADISLNDLDRKRALQTKSRNRSRRGDH